MERGAARRGRRPDERPLLCVVGQVFLGVAIGINALLAALVLIVPPTASPRTLTFDGMTNVHPERDGLVYMTAAVLSVVAALLLTRLPRSRTGVRSARVLHWLPVPVGAGVIVAAVAAFLHVRHSLPLDAFDSRVHLAFSLQLTALCALAGALAARCRAAALPAGEPPAAVTARPGPLDLIVPLLVFAFLYLPGWRELAGNAFAGEDALHLDFFGFGPGLAFRAGAALGTEVHPYYGLGWAVVFSRLQPFTYGHIIRLEVVYGCLYFSGVYVLLRVLVGDRRWAAVGTTLALLFQMFSGYPDILVLWRFPSATIMRWPFDIWFFIACALHLRTRRTAWTLVAGALVAVAVVFETETGLALGAAFALFWLCLWQVEGARSLRRLVSSVAVAAPVLVIGLGLASRWTLLSGAFWDGWSENLRISAAGGTLLPLTTDPTTWNIVVFVAITVTYLTLVGYAAVRVLGRRISAPAVMRGCIALYGLLTLMYFVGRSNPLNLFRSTVPFAILVAAGGAHAHRAWFGPRADGRSRLVPGAAAWGAVAVAVWMFLANPGVRAYPGLIRSAIAGSAPRENCLFEDPDDVCGLPSSFAEPIDDLRSLALRLRTIGSTTTQVAVLDQIGPIIQYMAGARPWGRYLPVFPGLFTRAQVGAVIRDLRDNPPGLVVMRSRADDVPFYADIWRAMRIPVERGFILDSREGPFEIWRRRGA